MYGIKVAAAVVGLTVLGVSIILGLVFGGLALFGEPWGGIAAVAATVVLMFVTIAVAENYR